MFDLQAFDTAGAGPRAILRVLQVLEHLAAHPQGRSLAQMCTDLKLPKTTLFTMLKTLQGSGHLQVEQGVYRLGPPAIALGAALAASAHQRFPECATEVLEALCRRTGETAILAVLTPDGAHCRYVAVIETDNWLRFTVERDSLKPSYATGTGHAMLAWLPPAEVDAILARVKMEKITPRTLGSRRAVLAELARVRSEQVSTSDSGTVAGVLSIAAPVFDGSGRVVAAVSAGGPSARMEPRLASVQRSVRIAAEEISRQLGYAAEWPAAVPPNH